MSPEENKAILWKRIKEVDKGNLAIIDEVCSPNFLFNRLIFRGWPRGLEPARALAAARRTMFTDLKATMEDIVAADDKVVVRWTSHGTYIGPVKMDFPSPCERFAIGTIAIYRFVDGKIEEDSEVQVCSNN